MFSTQIESTDSSIIPYLHSFRPWFSQLKWVVKQNMGPILNKLKDIYAQVVF